MAAPRPGLAVDLPVSTVELPVPEVAGTSWSGAYVGGHVGGVAAEFDGATGFVAETLPTDDVTPGFVNSGSFDGPELDGEAAMAGVQAGYNLQNRRLVVGVEGDFSWLGIRERTDFSISSAELIAAELGAIVETVDGYVSEQERQLDWLATFRGRIGIATERLLVYGTGGLAVAETTSEVSYFALLDDSIVAVSESGSDTRLGWVVGGGIEGAVTRDVTARLEYLFADLGTETDDLETYINVPDAFHQSASAEDDLTLQLLRFGLNYRF